MLKKRVSAFKLCLHFSAAADLRIGEVQWGDSGVYFCQVTIADDIEGQNEASVELLVLGELFLLSYCFLHHIVMQRISATNRNL